MTTDTTLRPRGGSRPKANRRRKGRLHDQPRRPIELELTGFAHGGYAVGHAPDGRVAFVAFGVPGERVIAEVTSESASYLEAEVVRVLEASPNRVEPRCEYFGRCGGCQLQHIDYAEQLRLKTEVVRDQLRRIGRFEDAPVLDMLGMDEPWGYRNHMRFTVRREGDVGFMERGTHRFLRIDHCDIAHPRLNQMLASAQDRTFGTRQIAMRLGEATGDFLVQPHVRWRPGWHSRFASGQKHYEEELLGQRYQVSAAAFFQVNTQQAERLVDLAVTRLTEVRPRVVVDAYSGVGTFAALLAPRVDEIVTIEAQPSADDDAAVNLREFNNVTRLVGSVETLLPGLEPSPDALVIDPPRTGVERSVIDAILASRARRVVYVSCEPSTLARDLRLLVDGGFRIVEVQPVDMFPHTQHIECVTTLDRDGPTEA